MSKHDCPSCVCGKIELTWSDRECWVALDDPEEVADAVVACTLDHGYDRTKIGVPYGFFNEAYENALAAVVREHFDPGSPEWKENRKVRPTPEQKKAFRDAILVVTKDIARQEAETAAKQGGAG